MKIKPAPLDVDVFGDGSVIMLRTAGHTPGHHSLLLELPTTGVVILPGDVWHFRKDYKLSLLTSVDSSPAEELASQQRLEKLEKVYHALLIIQHEPVDFAGLPLFPNYLH